MSCLEKCCVCVDDDLTTAFIYRCFIQNGDFDYPSIQKYKFRALISMTFDQIILLLAALVVNNFEMKLGMYVCFILNGLSFFVHAVLFLSVAASSSFQEQNACRYKRKNFRKTLLIYSVLQAEMNFKQLNFMAGALAYLGMAACPITNDRQNRMQASQQGIYLTFLVWMIVDLMRLIWFALKSQRVFKIVNTESAEEQQGQRRPKPARPQQYKTV